MATILIRDLPDPVHRKLAELAAQRRQSVNALVVTMLEEQVSAPAEPGERMRGNRGRGYRPHA